MNTINYHPHYKTVDVSCTNHITPESVRWLWENWLAHGKFHLLAGEPGTGKTHIALDMAATISTGGVFGRRWPDGKYAPVGNTIIW